jgi:hypothetical protein
MLLANDDAFYRLECPEGCDTLCASTKSTSSQGRTMTVLTLATAESIAIAADLAGNIATHGGATGGTEPAW